MSRTAKDLREMAVECRRLASTCNTTEAEDALNTAALELDESSERQDALSKRALRNCKNV